MSSTDRDAAEGRAPLQRFNSLGERASELDCSKILGKYWLPVNTWRRNSSETGSIVFESNAYRFPSSDQKSFRQGAPIGRFSFSDE